MKKCYIMLAVAMVAVMLASCGNSGQDTQLNGDTTSASEELRVSESEGETDGNSGQDTQLSGDTTSASEELRVSESEGETEENSGTEELPDDDNEYLEIAEELVNALNKIDRLGGSNVNFDESRTYTDEVGCTYAQTVDLDFASVGQIEEYLKENMTDEFIAERYSQITGTDSPCYIDYDGAVYVSTNVRAGGFAFTDSALIIENIGDESFRVLAEYDSFGATETMSLEIVRDSDRWKISSVTFGY